MIMEFPHVPVHESKQHLLKAMNGPQEPPMMLCRSSGSPLAISLLCVANCPQQIATSPITITMKFYIVASATEGLQIVEADRMEIRGGRICFTHGRDSRVFQCHEVNFWEECQTLETAQAARAAFELDCLIHGNLIPGATS
jgi:hypothetical protein